MNPTQLNPAQLNPARKRVPNYLMIGAALLLSACSQTSVEPPESELPLIPLVTRPSKPVCGTGAVAQAGGFLSFRDQNHFRPRDTQLGAQGITVLADTLQSTLISTRSMINSFYYGFSATDRQELHRKYTTIFKQERPNNLSTYLLNDKTDATMALYFGEMKDGHTFFLPPASYSEFTAITGGSAPPLPRFGLSLDLVPNKDGVVLIDVRGDGPGRAAGLRRGDVVLSVGGKALTRGSSDDVSTQAYGKIIADAAASASPQAFVIRKKGAQATTTVTFSAVPLSSATELPWGELIAGPTGRKVFYLRIPTFAVQGLAQRTHDLVAEAKSAGAEAVTIDLRSNGGGSVAEEIAASGAFAPNTSGVGLEDISADDATVRFTASGELNVASVCAALQTIPIIKNVQSWSGPTAVLVSGGSASASEYFAQAQRLGGKSVVVGEKTAGVGNTFTNIFALPGGRGASVTLGRVRGQDGQYYQESVTPDIAAADDLAKLADGNDLALEAALAKIAP